MRYIDLSNPEHSYFIGFFQADGSFSESTRNRGKVVIEILDRDSDLLYQLQKIFPNTKTIISGRIRATNFSPHIQTTIFSIYDYFFRQDLKSIGILPGKKHFRVTKPKGVIDVDYYRGLIDGDGSLGITGGGFPFLSLVTISQICANEYLTFLQDITGKIKTTTRNKRDGAFNIAVYKEDAQAVIESIYYKDCLCLTRKYISATEVLSWKKPKNMRKAAPKFRWDNTQDKFILTHSVKESMSILNRTKKSIETRLWRLSK